MEPPLGKPWLLYALLGCSLALNLVMVIDGPQERAARGAGRPLAPSPVPVGSDPVETAAAGAAQVIPDVPAEPDIATPAPRPSVPVAERAEGWNVAAADIDHSLARAFEGAAPEHADALTALYARLFAWDLDLRKDLHKGDRVETAWRIGADGKVEIAAARITSSKLGTTMGAWRWQRPGDAFASFWRDDGIEMPFRLVDGPLDEYEQITSLVKDRPTHKGMDFKVPVGTPVRSPRAGLVTRANWNHGMNGNCIEVRYDDGVLARFLHLSKNLVEPGARVAAGQEIAKSGNTGRSTAAHLHYELARDNRVVDPLNYHGTVRRHLESEQLVAFLQEQGRLESLLGQAVARR